MLRKVPLSSVKGALTQRRFQVGRPVSKARVQVRMRVSVIAAPLPYSTIRAAGKRPTMIVPWPQLLRISRLPPWASSSFWVSGSPRPVP